MNSKWILRKIVLHISWNRQNWMGSSSLLCCAHSFITQQIWKLFIFSILSTVITIRLCWGNMRMLFAWLASKIPSALVVSDELNFSSFQFFIFIYFWNAWAYSTYIVSYFYRLIILRAFQWINSSFFHKPTNYIFSICVLKDFSSLACGSNSIFVSIFIPGWKHKMNEYGNFGPEDNS